MKINRHEARKLMAQLRHTTNANGGNVDTVLLQDVVTRILEHLEIVDQDGAGV